MKHKQINAFIWPDDRMPNLWQAMLTQKFIQNIINTYMFKDRHVYYKMEAAVGAYEA